MRDLPKLLNFAIITQLNPRLWVYFAITRRWQKFTHLDFFDHAFAVLLSSALAKKTKFWTLVVWNPNPRQQHNISVLAGGYAKIKSRG